MFAEHLIMMMMKEMVSGALTRGLAPAKSITSLV